MYRKTLLAIAAFFVATCVLTASARADAPDIKSSGPIAFAPDGVLLVADPQSAAIFAIETGPVLVPPPDSFLRKRIGQGHGHGHGHGRGHE